MPKVQTALPEASLVEGRFWGIPNPEASELFFTFATWVAADFPAGITAAEAAERVQRDPDGVRARLDALAANAYLTPDLPTGRYLLPEWVRENLAWREAYRKREQLPSEPPGTEQSE